MDKYERVLAASERMTTVTMGMRKLEFPTGTRPATKARVSAVAWATNRRGRVPWKSSNVTTQISEYLAECGYVITTLDIAYVMKWVEDHKYGYRRSKPGGKRTLEFGFLKDVELTGHSPDGLEKIVKPGHVLAPPPSTAAQPTVTPTPAVLSNGLTPTTQSGHVAVMERPAAKVEIDVPLPGAPEHAPIYRIGELTELLNRWADMDPDAYAGWVDRALAQLGAVLG